MKKIALVGLVSLATFALSACGGEPTAAATSEAATAAAEDMMVGEATDAPTDAPSEAM